VSEGEQRRPGVEVRLNGTLAELLARMCVDLGTDDATGVISRALGLMDLAMRCKQKGQRVCVVDGEGNATAVTF
jgi:hypothetical protein